MLIVQEESEGAAVSGPDDAGTDCPVFSKVTFRRDEKGKVRTKARLLGVLRCM